MRLCKNLACTSVAILLGYDIETWIRKYINRRPSILRS